jgi:amidase
VLKGANEGVDAPLDGAAPIGLTGEGLPVGLQIIGPEGEDPTTIEFARLLAAEIGGFVPPPAYCG